MFSYALAVHLYVELDAGKLTGHTLFFKFYFVVD